MTTDTMPTGIDIEALLLRAGCSGIYSAWRSPTEKYSMTVPVTPEQMIAFVAAITNHLASIPERMSIDPDLSRDAKRALIEAGAAIRVEVG